MEWYWIVLMTTAGIAVWILVSVLFYRQFFKRFYDVFLSGLAIVVLSPLLLIMVLVGSVAMGGNPFFSQERPGKDERIFKLIKFRSMNDKKDDEGNLLPDEERLNKYGKLIRKTSLDELPELFNIFVGNMSIVGPRPLLVEYLPWYTKEERHRHDVRPGLTGLAQVNGRNNVGWDERFALDVKYVRSVSAANDLRIVFLTILKVIKRSDISVNTAEEGNMAKIRKAQLEKENQK